MKTLAYFPAAYPGELLYSLLARYHHYMGAPSSIHTMEALYGERLVVASLDLPGHLRALTDHLPASAGWTGVRIARELTLLPYYTAFQPPAVVRQARDAMVQGQTDGLLMRLGMATFRVRRVTTLQFCAWCLRDMHGQYEEYYWRRDHQLPGVLVCPDHGCPLQASTVSLPTRGRHIYIPAHSRTCPKGAPPLISCRSDEALADLQRVAIACRALLERPRAARPSLGWTRYYRQNLQRIGLAYSARRIDQQRLGEQFKHHHRNALEHLPDLMAGKVFRGDWLAAMVRKARGAFHPLQHVLLQDFIDHQEPPSGPFGEGPWLCVNPLARHSGKTVISTVELHRNHDHGVGVFVCDCGYVYTRSYFEGGEQVGLPRFQAYGPLLAPVLRRMIKAGNSLRMVADHLKLDPKTAVKLANDLGLATSWKPRTERKQHDRVRSAGASRQPGRRLGERCERRPCQRVDWPERDRQVSRQILHAAKVIRCQVPPVRICTLQIERRYWSRGWLSKRVGKLPKAIGRLRAVSESVQEFQRRRTDWVIRKMDETDEPLRVWRILRKAGLGPQHAGLVSTLLEEHIASARRSTT